MIKVQEELSWLRDKHSSVESDSQLGIIVCAILIILFLVNNMVVKENRIDTKFVLSYLQMSG